MWNDVFSRSRFDSNSNRIYIENLIRICTIQILQRDAARNRRRRDKTMGKYDDFELDLSVKSTNKSEDLKITNYPVCDVTYYSICNSCYSCPAHPLSCDCSASDMNACLGNVRC